MPISLHTVDTFTSELVCRDAGNGTLTIDNNMWSFSPKVNRVIKVPSSMMGQSWMGSDFSNKDVSRADDIIDQYEHTLIGEEEHEGHRVHVVESIPHEEAAVVWGKEVLRIRDDDVLLSQEFYDQDGKRVSPQTVRACIAHGWAEPWFANPLKPDWLVCKLTSAGRTLLSTA